MGLKDLIVDEAKLQESTIEKVIKPFVKYSSEGNVIVSPQLKKESAKNQIMIYLFAKAGSKFVSDGKVGAAACNEELERKLGLKGGTVRPTVKILREEGFVLTKDGRHQISDKAVYWKENVNGV